jgi:hypothetical protein
MQAMPTRNARLWPLRTAAMIFALGVLTPKCWAVDDQNQLTVHGQGKVSCGKYISDIALADIYKNYYMLWMQGFVTGINTTDRVVDTLQGTDDEGAMAWVNKYCHDNPTSSFFYAAAALVVYLRQQQQH